MCDLYNPRHERHWLWMWNIQRQSSKGSILNWSYCWIIKYISLKRCRPHLNTRRPFYNYKMTACVHSTKWISWSAAMYFRIVLWTFRLQKRLVFRQPFLVRHTFLNTFEMEFWHIEFSTGVFDSGATKLEGECFGGAVRWGKELIKRRRWAAIKWAVRGTNSHDQMVMKSHRKKLFSISDSPFPLFNWLNIWYRHCWTQFKGVSTL